MAVAGNELVKHSASRSGVHIDDVAAYCYGDLSEVERKAFERHLLECNACWSAVRRLDQAVGILRSNKRLGQESRESDMLRVLGISSRLSLPFGGHLGHVIIASALYALLYGVALVLEVSYQLEQYRPSVWWVSFGTFVWIFLTSVAGLGVDWRVSARSERRRPSYAIPILIGAAVAQYVALRLYLPDHPITEASFQTYPAHGAYLKDIGYFLPLGLVFMVLPFHFVLSMQKELSAGRHRLGLALLSGEKWSVSPSGSIYPRVWWLGILLFGALVVSLYLTTNLFDNLLPGSYRSLFVQLVLWRMVLYFSLGLECLFWYYRSLNELKRECLGVVVHLSQSSRA